MLFLLMLFVLYMVPVVPVARRSAWQLQEAYRQKRVRTYPARTLEKDRYDSIYVRVGGSTLKKGFVCQNCGGDKDYHPTGTYSSLRFYENRPQNNVCKNFKRWDGERTTWPEQTLPEYTHVPTMIASGLLRGSVWPLFFVTAGVKSGYQLIDPNWNNFAKPPADVRRKAEEEAEIASRQQRLDTLAADIKRREQELEIGQDK